MRKPFVSLFFCAVFSASAYSQNLTTKQLENWLNNPDAPIPTAKKQRKINEGKLTFLDPKKYKSVMHSENNISISDSSLKTGWVDLRQCYFQLDAFPRVQVVYKYRNIRHLKIISFNKINTARLEGTSVQMVNVKKGASLCVTAQIQSLKKTDNGYQLINGPFRRKFLDGYFPLRVSLTVKFLKAKLRFMKVVSPSGIKKNNLLGIQITTLPNKVRLDALFEGVLNTRLTFKAVTR